MGSTSLDKELGLKEESVQEDSGFRWSIYQGREPRRGNGFGRMDESPHLGRRIEYRYEVHRRAGLRFSGDGIWLAQSGDAREEVQGEKRPG